MTGREQLLQLLGRLQLCPGQQRGMAVHQGLTEWIRPVEKCSNIRMARAQTCPVMMKTLDMMVEKLLINMIHKHNGWANKNLQHIEHFL